MKKYLLLISFYTLVNTSIISQNFNHEFGRYSGEEFQMERYDKDPSAEAVVIYDIGSSFFRLTDEGYFLVFERKTKIKIFNKAGLKYAQFGIPYYVKDNDDEKIEELEGNTYNYENGIVRTTVLDMKNTYIEKESENWMVKKFAMPDVKEGSIIEVRYRITTPYFSNFRSWEFQNKIPVIYSEYVTKMIPFYEYTYILQGVNKFDSFRSYQEMGNQQSYKSITYSNMIYEFIMKNVPAFKDESFITSIEDYIIKLDFQLSAIHYPWGANEQVMATWPKLIEDMLDHESFGKYLKASQKKSKEITDTMKLTMKSDREKAEFIDKYLKSNFNWNGQYDKFSTKSVKDFIKTKTGNVTDINLFYTGILNSLGIEAYPVLISTRDHGKIKLNYPFQHFFNDVVVAAKIDDQYILLDATEPLSKFGEIPTQCLNDKGLIVEKDKEKFDWIDLKSAVSSDISYNIDLYPKLENDSVNGNFQIISTGYDAINLRKNFLKNPKDLKIELSINNITLSDSLKGENLYELNKPFELKFDGSSTIDKVEDKILVAPFCNFIMTDNPLKQLFRTYPVDMVYKKSKTYVSVIHMPDGYKIYTKPVSINIDNDEVKIQYLIETIDNNSVKVTGIYEFKKDVYGIASYFDLKGYFNKIIDKFNEKIILIKME
jgi:hypothetical protein